MPALIKKNRRRINSSQDDPYLDFLSEVRETRYALEVPSGAGQDWLGAAFFIRREEVQAISKPQTMLQPVSFDDEPDDRLKVVRLRPVDESEDHW